MLFCVSKGLATIMEDMSELMEIQRNVVRLFKERDDLVAEIKKVDTEVPTPFYEERLLPGVGAKDYM